VWPSSQTLQEHKQPWIRLSRDPATKRALLRVILEYAQICRARHSRLYSQGAAAMRPIATNMFLWWLTVRCSWKISCRNTTDDESKCVSRAWFTKYLATVIRLSYDNAQVKIDLRRTSGAWFTNILRFIIRLSYVYRKINLWQWLTTC